MKTSNKKRKKPVISPEVKIARTILIILFVFGISVMFFGCKPKEVIITKTEYRDRLKYDSIYLQKYDSIYVEKQGDTVRIEKYKILFKDRLKIIKDTVVKTDTLHYITPPVVEKVPVEVKVKGFYYYLGLFGFWALIAYILYRIGKIPVVNKKLKLLLTLLKLK